MADVTRGWEIYPESESQPDKGKWARRVTVQEWRSGEGVTLGICMADDEQMDAIVNLTPGEWRELTSLPVKFAAEVPSAQ